ncbi:MAG: chemotaxis protein CheW [Notoacmeibacter sp.]|nr:chemotaxis protein CheW [Notoacmeibacter sp.]
MTEARQFVTLAIAGELLAVPVDQVREILQVQPVSRLPHAPAHLLGMIDVRGQGVPVIDLRLKLGFQQVEDDENTRVIVLNVPTAAGATTFGLKTDRVFEVTALDETGLEPPPEIGVKWHLDLIVGIGRRNGAFVTVLNLEHLFSSSEATALSIAANQAA